MDELLKVGALLIEVLLVVWLMDKNEARIIRSLKRLNEWLEGINGR